VSLQHPVQAVLVPYQVPALFGKAVMKQASASIL